MEEKIKAVAYYRTSSASNVGEDKDSKLRQRDAVMAYAAIAGYEVIGEYYDAAVKGSDSVTDRKGFSEMLEYLSGNGARTILVENAGRFSRDIIVQITGYEYLKNIGINIIPVDAPTHFLEDTPSAEMVRGILGLVSQFEKKSLVDKMRKARDRKRSINGRCEGRKQPPEEVRKIAIELRSKGLTLREISKELYKLGHSVMKTTTENVDGNIIKNRVSTGRPYGPQSVKIMVGGK